MTIREQIEQTLHEAAPALKQLEDTVYLFGSSASILCGVGIASTQDIDLLTSTRDAERLQALWAAHDLHVGPKPSDRFRSCLSRYRFPLMDVEVCGGLEVHSDKGWQPLHIHDCRVMDINGFALHIPTLKEQRRILTLFNRPKDMEKINLIDKRIKQTAMQELVTVKVFNLQNDLHMAKSYLESEGISCFVADEYINQVYPLSSNATGGIKLQVPTDEAEQAVHLLIKGGFAQPEDFDPPQAILKIGKAIDWIKKKFNK